jgi:putative NADH-flavin reductase
MKVAVIGATGNIGSKIREELVRRGHSVTAVSRHPEKIPDAARETRVYGDAAEPDALASVLKGHDAIASSLPFVPGQSAKVIEAAKKSGVKRFVVVGGASSLDAGGGKILYETLDLPDAWRPAIMEGVNFLALLRKEHDLDWTFLSPAIVIGPGERTGKFRLADDTPVKDASGKSHISYDDYAIAFVDELETPRHVRRRFTVGY